MKARKSLKMGDPTCSWKGVFVDSTTARLLFGKECIYTFYVATKKLEEKEMDLGNKIATYRKEKNMTQEQLAVLLNVSNQAVSKWEASQCCPDVTLLPQLADIFGVTMDALFGRAVAQPPQVVAVPREKSTLPWEDDGALHAVLYVGHTLIGENDVDGKEAASRITFEYEGPALNVYSAFSVECEDVEGNVAAGTNVDCGDVEGNVVAGTNVDCSDVEGNVVAGTEVSCGDVEGNVTAGTCVSCGDIEGAVEAGTDVNCGDVEGDTKCGGSLNCGDINGDVECSMNVNCGDIEGDVSAGMNVTCGDIDGNVSATAVIRQ